MNAEATPHPEPTPPRGAAEMRPGTAIAEVLPFFDHLDAWVCVSDIETNRILYINAFVRRIFGDVEGEICWKVFQHDREEPCRDCTNHRLFGSEPDPGRLITSECRNSVTGRWYTCSSQGVSWIDGRPARLEISADITEQKTADIRSQHEAEVRVDARRVADLEFLAGGIAHDFNNLLMGVLGHAELAAMAGQDAASLRHHLNEIVSAARRATGLTEQLLAFSGRGHLHMEPLDLGPEVSRIVRDLIPGLPSSVRLATALEHRLPSVRADRLQVGLAVRSAVRNALEAMDGRPGVLRVATRLSTLTASDRDILGLRHRIAEGDYVLVEISDDGPGVPDAIRATAFEPFVSSHGPGRGLGLSAINGILRSHGGSAGLVDGEDGGALLVMAFPVETEDTLTEPMKIGATRPAGDAPGRTVLLVDDDATVREATSAMLEILGLSVIGAENGREALEILDRARTRIALVLTDAMMPELTGVEVLERIRSTGDDIPVVLSSGFAAKDVLAGLDRLHPNGFIKKPYRFADLKDAVLPLVCR